MRTIGEQYHFISSDPTGAPAAASLTHARCSSFACSMPSGVRAGSGPHVIVPSPLVNAHFLSHAYSSQLGGAEGTG